MSYSFTPWADTKLKIEGIVGAYQKVYKDEYEVFLKGQKIKHKNLDNKFALLKHTDIELRGLVEAPLTLYNLIRMNLQDDEWKWYESKEGKTWFGKTYPAFLMTEKL